MTVQSRAEATREKINDATAELFEEVRSLKRSLARVVFVRLHAQQRCG
jgi:hypothetical protein